MTNHYITKGTKIGNTQPGRLCCVTLLLNCVPSAGKSEPFSSSFNRFIKIIHKIILLFAREEPLFKKNTFWMWFISSLVHFFFLNSKLNITDRNDKNQVATTRYFPAHCHCFTRGMWHGGLDGECCGTDTCHWSQQVQLTCRSQLLSQQWCINRRFYVNTSNWLMETTVLRQQIEPPRCKVCTWLRCVSYGPSGVTRNTRHTVCLSQRILTWSDF